MATLAKIFGRTPKQIAARASGKKLEALAKTSKNKDVRVCAAERMDREEIWQYMALHDPENSYTAARNCKDLQFLDQYLEKLEAQDSNNMYFLRDHMDRVAFDAAQKQIAACNDQEKLFDLVMNNKTDIPEYKYLYMNSIGRIQDQALKKITNQEKLAQIAVKKGFDTAKNAISRISDPDALVKLAMVPRIAGVNCKEVLERLHDTDRLRYVAEHSKDKYVVQTAKSRIHEERSLQLCHNNHNWVTVSTDTSDDGDSPRLDYKYEKCTRCGVVRYSTYISGRFFRSELRYSAAD